MTQFKDKRDRAEFVSAGLFTYPALMAADILLYDTEEVPVGDDQRQHVELTRDVAERFNSRYGATFTVPKATIRAAGARVMDLQEPDSQDVEVRGVAAGTVSDPRRSVRSRQEDQAGGHRHRQPRCASIPTSKPGVSNLLSILGACTGESPDDVAGRYTQYGPLKADTADAVIELLRPIQDRYRELAADPRHGGQDPRPGCREGAGDSRPSRSSEPSATSVSSCAAKAEPRSPGLTAAHWGSPPTARPHSTRTLSTQPPEHVAQSTQITGRSGLGLLSHRNRG